MAKQKTIEVTEPVRCECGNPGTWAHVDDVNGRELVDPTFAMCDDRRSMLLNDGCTDADFVKLELAT